MISPTGARVRAECDGIGERGLFRAERGRLAADRLNLTPNTVERVQQWVLELRRMLAASVQIVLCGNKADLIAQRTVSQEDAEAYAAVRGKKRERGE